MSDEQPSTNGKGTGWWPRSDSDTAPVHREGAEVPPQSGDPRWSWELPTDTIGGRRGRWTSIRVALPVVFGLVIVAALLAGGLGAAVGISSERSNNTDSGPIVFASSPPTKG